MIYRNNPHLRKLLEEGGWWPDVSNQSHFQFDDAMFKAEVARVREQHPELTNPEDRAAYRIITLNRRLAPKKPIDWNRWLNLAWKVAILLLLLRVAAKAQTAVNIDRVGGTRVASASGIPINCVSGCGGASSFTDNSAFTFGTTSINNISAVVDDIATNAVAENSAGAVRMSGSRILYVDLSKSPANTNKFLITADPITFASPQHVICDSGCSLSLFADSSAFTFTTTSVNNISAVVDDVATNTVAENSAGAVRMNTNRILYVDLSKSAANTNKFLVTADAITFAAPQHVLLDANSGVDIGKLTANQSVNIAQVAGTATSVNSGVKDAGTIRVVIATDQPQLTQKLLVTPDSVALPANQSVNVAQMNGVATSMGSGIMGTGVQRVAIASDNDPVTVKQATAANLNATVVGTGTFATQSTLAAETTKVVGTVRIIGNAGATVDAAVGAGTAPTNGVDTLGIYNTTVPVPTAGQSVSQQVDSAASLYVNPEGRKTTYHIAVSALACAASTTFPCVTLFGSGTKTVRVTHMRVSGSAGTAALQSFFVNKLSSAPTGGTSTSFTAVPLDSNDAGATATSLLKFTVVATGGAAIVGTISSYRCLAGSATVADNCLADFQYGNMPGAHALVLRGTAQGFGMYSTIATTVDFEAEWTEE